MFHIYNGYVYLISLCCLYESEDRILNSENQNIKDGRPHLLSFDCVYTGCTDFVLVYICTALSNIFTLNLLVKTTLDVGQDENKNSNIISLFNTKRSVF